MDYSNPDPKDVVSIALRKLPALVPRSQRRGSLLINPGGPGGSGHASVLRFGRDLSVILQGHYDIIGFVRRQSLVPLTSAGPARRQPHDSGARLLPI